MKTSFFYELDERGDIRSSWNIAETSFNDCAVIGFDDMEEASEFAAANGLDVVILVRNFGNDFWRFECCSGGMIDKTWYMDDEDFEKLDSNDLFCMSFQYDSKEYTIAVM